MSGPWTVIAELEVDPERAWVHAEGWQSWTPTTRYRLDGAQHGPVTPRAWVHNYGGSRPRPDAGVFQGDGLLVLDPGTGQDVLALGASSPEQIPVIRLIRTAPDHARLVADAPVSVLHSRADGGVHGAAEAFAERFAVGAGVGELRSAPSSWCTWYAYFRQVSARDVTANLTAIAQRELPVDVVLIDDGYAQAPGDWLIGEPAFGALDTAVDAIRADGRRAGIWLAPFVAGSRSRLAAEHPEWLLRGADGAPVWALHNWDQDTYALDVTHPGCAPTCARSSPPSPTSASTTSRSTSCTPPDWTASTTTRH